MIAAFFWVTLTGRLVNISLNETELVYVDRQIKVLVSVIVSEQETLFDIIVLLMIMCYVWVVLLK